MIKVTSMTNTDANENTYKVTLFADTKDEVASATEIIGFPEGATIEMGSCVVTANAEVAFRKSDGTWNWVE